MLRLLTRHVYKKGSCKFSLAIIKLSSFINPNDYFDNVDCGMKAKILNSTWWFKKAANFQRQYLGFRLISMNPNELFLMK